MQGYKASLERLRMDAAEAAAVRDQATDHEKNAFYHRLHLEEHDAQPRVLFS